MKYRDCVAMGWKIRKKISGDGISRRTYAKKYVQRSSSSSKLLREPFVFSIVVPVYKTNPLYLGELVSSIQHQTYSNYQLILADGSGEKSIELTLFLEKMAKDKKTIVVSDGNSYHIAENTNRGMEVATGDYIIFVDHDDVLAPTALESLAEGIGNNPQGELFYSDEDKLGMDGGVYFQPHFKPDYDPFLLRSMNYFCHLVAIKSDLARKIGPLKSHYNGAQDYDYVLRAAKEAKQIVHIREVLYHWRAHNESTAGNQSSKNYAVNAGSQVLEDMARKEGIPIQVRPSRVFGIYTTIYSKEKLPPFSVVVAASSYQGGEEKIKKLKECYGDNIIDSVVENSAEGLLKAYERGCQKVQGEYVLLLEDHVSFDVARLGTLIGHVAFNQVAVAGGLLQTRKGETVNASFFVGENGRVCVPFLGYPQEDPGYFGYKICMHRAFGVSLSFLAVHKQVFLEALPHGYACTRWQEAIGLFMNLFSQKKTVLYNPAVVGMQKERGSKKRLYLSEGMQKRYQELIQEQKQFYNPHLQLTGKLYTLK